MDNIDKKLDIILFVVNYISSVISLLFTIYLKVIIDPINLKAVYPIMAISRFFWLYYFVVVLTIVFIGLTIYFYRRVKSNK